MPRSAPGDIESSLTLPPHSIDAEQAVLGACMLDSVMAERVVELLAPDDFYNGAHRTVYLHIVQLVAERKPADPVTVSVALAASQKLDYVGGLSYLGALAQNVPTAANAEHYARIVLERSRRRAIMVTAAEIGSAAASAAAPASDVLLVDAQERLECLARADDTGGLAPLDFAAMALVPVPERKFRVGRIMPTGAPGLWTGHGGAGKTQAALHLAMCIALGRDFFGEAVQADRVAYVSTEDDADDVHYRLAHQVRLLGATLKDLEGRLFGYDFTAVDPVLVTAAADGSVAATPRYAALRADLRRRGVSVVFLDNFATLCAVDLIRPAHATQAIALCAQLVPKDGNAILIAHVDKATAKAGHSREAYSGTAAFHNRARWRWYLFAPNAGADAEDAEEDAGDDGRRILEVQKVNAGRSGSRIALRILDNGAIASDGIDDSIVGAIARRSEREAVLAAMQEAEALLIPMPTATTNRSTAYEALEAMPSFPVDMRGKLGKRRLFKLLMQLRVDGEVTVCEFRGGGRHLREGYRLARIAQ